MAVSADFTILDISGKFIMNKQLSDETDEILRLQGVGWWKRKAISIATVTLAIKHYKDDDGIEHIDIDQTLTGGIPGTTEIRVLTWTERPHEDHLFGAVIGKSRRCKAEEMDDDFLTKGWTADTYEHGLVQAYGASDTPKSGTTWIAIQTWGMEDVDGVRRYVRHVHFTGPQGEDIQARLVYDYQGPVRVTESRLIIHQEFAVTYPDSHPSDSRMQILPGLHTYTPSSQTHRDSPPLKDANVSVKDASQLECAETESTPTITHEAWYVRWGRQVFARSPRKLKNVLLYIRGPRPTIDLPDPVPLLDRSYRLRHSRFTLSLESALIKHTRSLSAPWLLFALGAAYIVAFAFFSRAQSFITPPESYLGCTSTFWLAKDGCGLDGDLCGPFDNETFNFRCPAQCDGVILQNPRTVGDERVAFKPLIVGGGDGNQTYRGDSFICAAAIQAGIVSNARGGCASLELINNFTNFVPYSANGLGSIGFPTIFPISFRLNPSTTLTHCNDLRNPALALNVIATFLLFTVLHPKPIVLFWCLVCIGFWHVALFSQPQGPPPELSNAFGTFLPALFIAYAFWRVAFRFTLPSFSKLPLEASVLYLAPYWVAILNNLTFDRIPISRLTSSDLAKRSGAITSLIIILIILTIIVINQIRVVRKTGWLPYYAGWYILGGLVILVIALLPGLQLRIHHYILAMILMPGTAFPTRLSAFYQGLLLGLFLNGAAAFGFDSIVQTTQELRQDAALGSSLPTFLTDSTTYNASLPWADQIVSWAPLLPGWDGYALLIDDVERYVGTAMNYSLAALDATLPHFFRLAFTANGAAGDFTMAAILWPNGTWVDPLTGPS
ncbi:hypothetical protein AX17_000426 [Amanita inopinata Kibby_2008]|nr:hypothetical protein AX17_000426 [Amanita inopinata Kibby_2008]